MASITTGDWQRIGYWQIGQTSYNTIYVSLNAKVTSQDVANNRSTVATLLNIDVIGSGSYNTDSVKAGLTGGSDISWGYTTITNGKTLIQGSYTVNHNSDGTASTTIGCWVTQTFGGSLSWGDATVSLPTIPRASQPSINTWPGNSPNITAGTACTIHMNRASTSFTHKVTYSIGSASGTIASSGVTDNVSWTPPTSLCAQFPNATSKSGTITVTTYNGSTEIGSKSCTFNLSIPSNSNPTLSSQSVTEQNSKVSAKGSSITIQQISSKKVSVVPSAKYSASISKVVCNGVTLANSGGTYSTILTNLSTGTFTFTVTDSRGLTGSVTVNTTYYSYNKPQITSGSLTRTEQTSSTGSLNVGGTYSTILSNTVTMNYERKVNGTSEGSSSVTPTLASGNVSFSKSYTDLHYTNSYQVVITITDLFGEVASATINLGQGQYALWLGKTGAKTSGDLTVGGNENISGALTVGGKLNANSDISASGLISSSLMVGSSWDFDWLNTGVLFGIFTKNAPFDCSLVISGGDGGTRTQVAYDLWNGSPPKTRYLANGNWSSWNQVKTKTTNSIFRVAEAFAHDAVSQNSTITRHRFTEAYTYDSDYFSVVASDNYYYLKCNKSARYIVLMNIKFTNVSGTYMSACGFTDDNGNATWDLERCDEFTTILSGIHSATWFPFITAGAPIYYTAASGVTRNVEHCYMMILAIG